MRYTKSFFQSKTIWGILLMISGYIGSKLGVDIQETDLKVALDVVFNAIEAVGAIIAVYGRVKATKKIGS